MANDWDYKPDLGKTATDNVDDVVETEDDQPEFGFEMDDDEESDVEETEDDSMDEEAEERKPVAPAKPPTETSPDAQAVKEQVLRLVGDTAVVKVKGVERPLKDFSPDEVVNWISKAMRADQVFNEAAATRKQVEEERRQLEEHRALLEKGAAMVQDRLAGGGERGKPTDGNVPDFLKPGAYDTEEVTALKEFAAQQQQRLDKLEGTFTKSKQQETIKSVQQEIETLGREYPMASKDEVLAVKLAHMDTPTEELMRMAHDYYAGGEHIETALKHNPTFKREYDERVIKQYLARKQSAKKIAGQPAAANSSSSKVSERGKIPIHSFDDATKASRAYLRESKRLADES